MDLFSNKLVIFSVNIGEFSTIGIELDPYQPHFTSYYVHIYKSMKAYLKLWSSGKAKWMVILTFWLFVYDFPTANLFSTRMKIPLSILYFCQTTDNFYSMLYKETITWLCNAKYIDIGRGI